MTFKGTIQVENSSKRDFLEILNSILNITGESQKDLAKRLGYTKDVFSNIKSIESYKISPQLFAALKILFQLECLKKGMQSETQREHYFALAEKFNSSSASVAEEKIIESYAAERRGRRRKT